MRTEMTAATGIVGRPSYDNQVASILAPGGRVEEQLRITSM
jgi:hypothetical protein